MPVKAHNLVGMVECYYSLLYRIYHIIIAELLDINKDIALQIAFKVINNFNYLIMVDIIYINSIPLLYIINKGTQF